MSVKTAVEKLTGSPFCTLSDKPLDFIEKQKLYKIIFNLACFAVIIRTFIYPFEILFRMIYSGYFNFGFRYVAAFILIWAAIAAACWLGLNLWWKRRKKADEFGSSDFVAIPFFAELIRTFGEWLGILFGIIGAVGGFFSLIFLGRHSGATLSVILFGPNRGADFGMYDNGLLGTVFGGFQGMTDLVVSGAVILGPIAAVVIIFVTRLISENLLVLAAIANNTKKTTSGIISLFKQGAKPASPSPRSSENAQSGNVQNGQHNNP